MLPSTTYERITWECRWFFEGKVPETFIRLFQGIEIETRTDVYLFKGLSNGSINTTEGIKLREGGLEIKTLQEEVEIKDPFLRLQKWRKVRSEIPQGFKDSYESLDLTKRRKLVRHSMDSEDQLVRVSHMPLHGCNMELTAFENPFEKYWTFGLEAYGQENVMQDYLIDLYKDLQERDEIISIINTGVCESYPQWLSGFHN